MLVSDIESYGRFEAVDYSGIIVVTYSSDMRLGLDHQPVVGLSSLSLAALHAGVLLHKQTGAPLYAAGERSFAGYPTTSELMRQEAFAMGVKPQNFTVVRDSRNRDLNNTPYQITALRDHFGTQAPETPRIAVAMDYHIPRINAHKQALGLVMECVSVQSVLKAHDKEDDYPVLNYLEPFADRERLVRLTSKIDPKGRLLNFLMKLQGPRLHNVEFREGHKPKVVIDRTKPKHDTINEIAAILKHLEHSSA